MKHGWIKTLALILALMLSAGQALAEGSLLDGFLTSTQIDDAGRYIGSCSRYEVEKHDSGDIINADTLGRYPADLVISEGFFWASGASDSQPDRALSYALMDLDGNIVFEIRKGDTLGTPSRVVDGRFYIRSGSDDAPSDTNPDAVSSNIIFDAKTDEIQFVEVVVLKHPALFIRFHGCFASPLSSSVDVARHSASESPISARTSRFTMPLTDSPCSRAKASTACLRPLGTRIGSWSYAFALYLFFTADDVFPMCIYLHSIMGSIAHIAY